MAYEKQNFIDSQTLKAEHLNHIEDGIANIWETIYPVGSIYMSVNSTSPAQLFGGTWTQLKDRFLLGAGDNYSNGATGGQSTITLEESDLPSGAMIFDNTAKTTGWSCGAWSNVHGQSADWYAMPKSQTTNQTYTYPTNMPPYLVVYMWKRTA